MPTSALPALSVLTLNIHLGLDLLRRRVVLPQLREAIRGVGADLVFLQEVPGEHRGHARRHRDWPGTPHYAFLADTLWPQFAYGRNAVLAHGHLGNALLSKLPIQRHRNHDVSLPGHEARGLLHCVLEAPGEPMPLHAICVHLGLRASHRHAQLERLAAVVRRQVPDDAPLVVAGDFNDWRATGHRQLRAMGLVDAFAQHHGMLARSFPAWLPLLPLDRIYVRGLAVAAAQAHHGAPWSCMSDHVPLSAHLHLPCA